MEAFAERGRACCRHYPRGQLLRTQQVRGSAGLADRRKRRFSTWRRRICQVAWALDDLGLASGCASRSGQRLPAPRRNYILSKERAVAFDACSPGGFRRVDTGLLFVKSSPQEKERARARAAVHAVQRVCDRMCSEPLPRRARAIAICEYSVSGILQTITVGVRLCALAHIIALETTLLFRI